MAKTREEKFILKLYEAALLQGEWDSYVDSVKVAKAIGVRENSFKTILQLLTQGNFIKKPRGVTEVCLTEHGLKLVKSLLGK